MGGAAEMIAYLKDKDGNVIDIILNVTAQSGNVLITKNAGKYVVPKHLIIETAADNPAWKTDEDIKDFIKDSMGRVLYSKLKDGVI